MLKSSDFTTQLHCNRWSDIADCLTKLETLKSNFKHNNYPQNFVNQYIKRFLNKLFIKKDLNFMVPKRKIIFVLPYLGKLSFDLRTKPIRTVERDLPYCKLKIVFRSKCRLNTLFRFKDPLEKKIRSGIIYRYRCSNCKVTYYGKTFCHFYTRVAEHMGISNLTGKRLKTLNSLQYLTIYCSVIAP